MIKIKPKKENGQAYFVIEHSEKIFRRQIRNGLIEVGAENVRHLRNLLKDRKKKTGHWYFYKRHASHGGGFWYQASAPYEVPARRSGMLWHTTFYRTHGSTEVEFGDSQKYGKYLEFGTRGMSAPGQKGQIEPRPHIRVVVRDKEKDNFNSMANNVYRSLIKKRG